MTRQLGDVIARGTRSTVRAYGPDAVVKIPARATPGHWIVVEARYCVAVRAAGAPAPRLLGLETIAGRPASVWERVAGPTMWEAALAEPDRCGEYGVVLADLQLALFDLVPPVSLPRQRDRLVSKIRRSALTDSSLAGAAHLFPPATLPPRVCHGDLHPGNVILGEGGPMVVDWFDVSRGDPIADIARSTILMSAGDGADAPRHLPGASRATLGALADAHLDRLRERMALPQSRLEHWRAIEAVARLAEGVAPTPLLEVWRRFDRGGEAGGAGHRLRSGRRADSGKLGGRA